MKFDDDRDEYRNYDFEWRAKLRRRQLLKRVRQTAMVARRMLRYR